MNAGRRKFLALGVAFCGCFGPQTEHAWRNLLEDIDFGVGMDSLGSYIPISDSETEFSPEVGAELGIVLRLRDRLDLSYTYGKVDWFYSTVENGIGGLVAALIVGGGSHKMMEIEMHHASISYRLPIKETSAAAFLIGGMGVSDVAYSQGGGPGYLDYALHASDQPLWPPSAWRDNAPSIRAGVGIDLNPWKRLHIPVSLMIYKIFTEPRAPGFIRFGVGLTYFVL